MGTARHFQPFGCDRYAFFRDLVNLLEKSLGVDDHTVSKDAGLVRMDDARWQQPQYECQLADIYAMAGVVPALVPGNDIKPVCKQIDDFSLSLIAPLGADDDYDHKLVRNTP